MPAKSLFSVGNTSSAEQSRCLSLRPVLDKIHDPAEPPAIIFKYLDHDMARSSRKQRLNRQDINFEVTILVDFNFHIFEPDVPESHELYDVKILVLHHLWFGPFPVSYKNICDQETQASIVRIMSVSNRE
ncbi:quinate utilisation oxidoreductase QutH [Aspergillus luchuensis]|uniref:Quinate utilisation oxidoreductase QutH n=1 Tax=Aspergillus kawachii TaxID=1069201 RepID=A0A146FES3_ASPKA|nr:quinate utilisation oxidoreductase QutH [Aspergillus luchuensis]